MATPLSPQNQSIVKTFGFTVHSDGYAYLNDQNLYSGTRKQEKLQHDRETSFMNIASVGGDKRFIDDEDIVTLQTSPQKLGAVIAGEPDVKEDILQGDFLAQRKTDSFSRDPEAALMNGIPKVAYKRTVALLQLGLNQTTRQNLPINGIFGPKTLQAVNVWRALVKMNPSDKADRNVFGSLIVKLQTNKEQLLKGLDEALVSIRGITKRTGNDGVYFREGLYNVDPKSAIKIVKALQYLYPDSMMSWKNPDTLNDGQPDNSDTALIGVTIHILMQKFGASLIGPNTIGKIKDKISYPQ